MSSYVGVVVSDPELHSQFTQVELRTLKSKVHFQHHIFFMSKVSNVYLGALYSLIQIKRSWIASPLEIYLLFSPSSTLLVAPLMPMRSNLFWTSLIPMLIKKSISRLSSGWFLSSFLLICFFFNQLLMDGFRIGLPKCASPGSRKIRRVERFFLVPQN